MKFSNTIKTVLKIYQKYVKNSVWFGMGIHYNRRIFNQHRLLGEKKNDTWIYEDKKMLRTSKIA